MIYVFDGSFTGLLCCVFETFEMREWQAIPVAQQHFQQDIFSPFRTIDSIDEKAERLITAIKTKFGLAFSNEVYRAYLSEDPFAWQCLHYLLVQKFKGRDILKDYGDPKVLYFHQTLKKVSRERHRMKAFIRFQKSSDELYVAVIEPDFNVLPLILAFFKNRYSDQRWLIYDLKRDYGALYDKTSIEEVILSKSEQRDLNPSEVALALDQKEVLYQSLWKSYFKSTNIEARRNMKLHLQHVPKRYWKYLTEK